MRKTGELVQWNNKGGYGFVRDEESGRDYYLHISNLEEGGRPKLGDIIGFELGKGRKGKPAAVAATIQHAAPAPQASLRDVTRSPSVSRFKVGLRTAAATVMTLLILWAIASANAPVWIGLLYGGMGLASALLYRFDKLYALEGKYRVSEHNLHVVDLCCGIIGGLAAQEVYRHKTVKPRFVAATWSIALVHTLGLAALAFG